MSWSRRPLRNCFTLLQASGDLVGSGQVGASWERFKEELLFGGVGGSEQPVAPFAKLVERELLLTSGESFLKANAAGEAGAGGAVVTPRRWVKAAALLTPTTGEKVPRALSGGVEDPAITSSGRLVLNPNQKGLRFACRFAEDFDPAEKLADGVTFSGSSIYCPTVDPAKSAAFAGAVRMASTFAPSQLLLLIPKQGTILELANVKKGLFLLRPDNLETANIMLGDTQVCCVAEDDLARAPPVLPTTQTSPEDRNHPTAGGTSTAISSAATLTSPHAPTTILPEPTMLTSSKMHHEYQLLTDMRLFLLELRLSVFSPPPPLSLPPPPSTSLPHTTFSPVHKQLIFVILFTRR